MEPALVEEKRAHAEKLIQDGYYADAICALDALARNRDPRTDEHAQWAREQLPKVKARLKKARSECRDACALAEQLYADCDYAAAVEVLEKFKRGSRSNQAEGLLEECKKALKKVTKLNEKIDKAIYHKETDTDEFFDTIEMLLELDPKDRRARQWNKKLIEQRKMENHLGWRLGLAALCLICLGAVIWIGKLVLYPDGEGTITIKLREPGYRVYIDGELLPSSDYDKKLDRFEPGEHKLELRRGLETAFNYKFTIEANIDKTLEVPKAEEVASVSEPSTEPLPEDVPTEPLESEPLASIEPELDPQVDPMPVTEEPVATEPEPKPVEPQLINGFPIAKQTNYLRLEGPRINPKYAVFSAGTKLIAAERLTSDPIDLQKTYEIPIWDTTSGKAMQLLKMDPGEIQGLAFSPDGKMLAVALVNSPEPNGGTLQVWNVETGAIAQSMTLDIAPGQSEVAIKGAAFSPDGTMIGVINQDSAYVWLLSDGKLKAQKSMAPAKLTSIGFFPAGEILILGASSPGNDGVMSWDIERSIQRGFLQAPSFGSDASHPVFALSRDLSVMTVLNGNSIRRYATQNQRYVNIASLPTFLGEDKIFEKIAYSPSGQYVMASVPGRRPLIWQDSDYDRVAILGETAFVGAYAAAFAPDSKSVLELDRPENTDLEASAAVIRTWQIRE